MKYAKDFRSSARNALRDKWWEAVAAGFVASLFGAINSTEGSSFSFSTGSSSEGETGAATELINPELYAIIAGILGTIAAIALVVGIALFLVGSVVSAGYAQFNLDLIDGNRANIKTLFSYFPHWKKLIATNILKNIFITLWTLLFIIPGIIATYNYAMVPYILAEDPTLSPKEAIAQSKAMMYGHRWRLFCLEFSFIGWAFLAALSCGIGYLWLTPYQQASYADFYREISGTRSSNEFEVEIIEEV